MARTIVPLPFPSSPSVSNPAELGQFVRSQRTSLGLRIDDAAALCGVSVQLLSDLETGKRSVGLDKVFQVLQKLGLSLLIASKHDLPDVLHRLQKDD